MNIKSMIPYLDEDSLLELANLIVEGKENNVKLNDVISFLDDEQLNHLYERFVSKEVNFDINSLLPYLEEENIIDLYKRIVGGEFEGLDEEQILPYLDDDGIKEIFNEYVALKRGEKLD